MSNGNSDERVRLNSDYYSLSSYRHGRNWHARRPPVVSFIYLKISSPVSNVNGLFLPCTFRRICPAWSQGIGLALDLLVTAGDKWQPHAQVDF